MARPKEPLASASQLEELMSSLAKSGAVQYFLEIRRRAPGVKDHDKLWERWKFNLPADDVEDIRDYCYSAGGEHWEYKVWVKDGSGNPVKGSQGQKLGPYLIPAAAAPPPELAPGVKVPVDPDLAERASQIKRQRVELDIQRQEAQLERDRRRLDKLAAGEEEDADEDGDWVYNPMLGGYFPKGYNPMMMGMQMPWQQQQQQQRPSDTVELAKAFAPIVAALVARPSEKLQIKDIIPLLVKEGKDNGWAPKDMIGFIGPLMAEVTKATGDVNKIAMERMADSDQFWKEKLIEAAKLGGADADEVDKWRKILGLVTDTVKEGTKLVFGRPTILKGGSGGSAVDVPVIEKGKVPGLPAPGGKPQAAGAQGEDAAAEAKRVVKERVDAFLIAHEQEMLIGSDPALVADKLDELYLMLPLPLRAKIEASDTATIYEALREHNAQVVDRILAAVGKDGTGGFKQWCEAFWEEIKNPPDEEEAETPPGEGGGGAEGGGGEG